MIKFFRHHNETELSKVGMDCTGQWFPNFTKEIHQLHFVFFCNLPRVQICGQRRTKIISQHPSALPLPPPSRSTEGALTAQSSIFHPSTASLILTWCRREVQGQWGLENKSILYSPSSGISCLMGLGSALHSKHCNLVHGIMAEAQSGQI